MVTKSCPPYHAWKSRAGMHVFSLKKTNKTTIQTAPQRIQRLLVSGYWCWIKLLPPPQRVCQPQTQLLCVEPPAGRGCLFLLCSPIRDPLTLDPSSSFHSFCFSLGQQRFLSAPVSSRFIERLLALALHVCTRYISDFLTAACLHFGSSLMPHSPLVGDEVGVGAGVGARGIGDGDKMCVCGGTS